MISRSSKATLLATAVTALSATLATQALAADAGVTTAYPPSLTSTVIGSVVSGDGAAQSNTANVTAGVLGSTITTTVVGATTGSFTNSSNTADALAQGNVNGVTVSLATISSSGTTDGIGIATVSNNSGAITANATGQTAGTSVTGTFAGSVEVANNSIDATTIINNGSGTAAVSLSGSVPVGYSNTATGPATAVLGGATDALAAVGTLVAGNSQFTNGANSAANATGNTVSLDLLSATGGTVTGSAVLDGNNIGATFTGNTRTTSIDIVADTASFGGSAVIANGQSFDGNTVSGDNASNTGSRIAARVDSAAGTNVLSNSSLSVDGNQVTSAATGNRLAASISLADALSYNSPGGNIAIARNGVNTGGNSSTNVTGGLAIASSTFLGDFAANAFLNATTDGAVITAGVQETVGSAVTLSANRVTAAVTGNALDSSISSGDGSALINTSATLASRQQAGQDNNGFTFDLKADATNTTVSVVLGDTGNGTVSGSSGTMAGNVIAASAIGSQAAQDITLEAVNLETGLSATLTANSAPALTQASLDATGAVLVSSLQLNLDSDVSANSTGNAISLTSNDDDGVTSGTNLAVTGNIQQAFAMAGTVANSIDLTAGGEMWNGAGVANSQFNNAGSTVTATQTGTVTLAVTESAGGGASAPSLSLTGNRSEALATGFAAGNSIDVDANSLVLSSFGTNVDPTANGGDGLWDIAGGGLTLDTATTIASSTSSFAVLNSLSILDNVTASARPLSGSAAFTVSVGDDTQGAGVTNDANRLTAQAQGVTATNALALDAGSIEIGFGNSLSEAARVASVMNVQLVDAAVSATAAPSGAAATVLTSLGNAAGDDVSSASVTTSGNRVTAIADGAIATNSLNVSATTLEIYDGPASNPLVVNPDAGLATVNGSVLTANAAVAMINRQQFSSNDAVTATLRQADSDAITDSALVLTRVAGDITSSSIASNANQLTALASSLEAANSLMLDGTTLRTSGALLSSQSSGAVVNATIGYAGNPAVPEVPFTLDVTGVAGGFGTGTFDTTGLTTDEINSILAFLNAFPTVVATLTGSIITATGVPALANGPQSPIVPAIPRVPNAGGVVVTVGENITGSSISVAGNMVTGQALGNTASNSLSVAATSLDADGANVGGTGAAGLLASGAYGADDDYALTSDQSVTAGSASNAEVFATFAIDQALDQAISNATLAVNGNALVAEAMANNVTNTLSLSATDMTTLIGAVQTASSASLANRQGGTANVDARSDVEAYANIQSSGSTISIDGNSNRAIGVINNAANSLSVDATNIGGTGANATSSIVTADTRASGSFALNNSQTTAGTLDTTADSSIFNTDALDTASTGLVGGSVSMANNLTFAESSANRASNSVSVMGGASSAAPAALANDQASAAAVNATATSSVSASLTGTGPATEAADGSAISVAGNTTQALARGNTATNTMVFSAGADFGTVTTGASANGTAGTASGAAAMLNRQENTGAVGASATASYQVALNAGGSPATGSAAVLNSAVSVSGNTVAATAFGNQATNRMELAVLNSGNATAAFNNTQSNSGVITASASNVTFSSSVTGTVTNGAFRNVGNAASATAVGNSAFTSIVGR